jgi:spore germination cell wall hydrolase CwlJ-like protein
MYRLLLSLVASVAALVSVAMAPAAQAMPFGLVEDGELECLALNIYFESRAEPVTGQLAVAHTTLNRVDDAQFPDSVCQVVRQGGEKRRGKCQFSWWCDGRSDRVTDAAAWERSLKLAQHAMRYRVTDPTDGALYFHNVAVSPRWARAFELTARIGRHIFYR